MANENPTGTKSSRETTSIKQILTRHLRLLVEDVVVPLRVIVATSVIFILFLVADQIIFYIIDLISSDIKSRVPFVSWLLDGVQVLSLIAVSVYFVISGINNLHTQFRVASKIETKARLK
jgi:hypothetical protein